MTLPFIQYLIGNPALILLLATLPLLVLGRWKNIYPDKWLVALAMLPVIPSISIAFRPIAGVFLVAAILFFLLAVVSRAAKSTGPPSQDAFSDSRTIIFLFLVIIVSLLSITNDALPIIAAIDIIVLCVLTFDIITIPRPRQFQVERVCQQTASLKKKHPVTLTVSNLRAAQGPFQNLLDSLSQVLPRPTILVRDDVPQEFAATPDEFEIALRGRTRRTLPYYLMASRRGAFELHNISLQTQSRLGLWKRIITYPVESTINVYPDMKQLAEFELLARSNRLSLMGVRRTRRIGQDNDFERLRDYTLDDNYKHIDWRSTARRQKLTVRDFQTSQSQRVIFMIDCGRMMTNQAAGLSLLDHSLNAMLMLSYIALQRGDSVGLLCFSDQVHSFVPPRGGSRQMNHLLRSSFDRFPELVESRYGEAFLHLSKHCRKRSLVILITNLIDEINAKQVHQYLSTMVGRHLPLGVLMRDHELFRAADTNWRDDAGLYRAAAAAEIVCWRHEVVKELQHQGVLSLDVYPEDMTAPLINQYLEVKARHLL